MINILVYCSSKSKDFAPSVQILKKQNDIARNELLPFDIQNLQDFIYSLIGFVNG